MSRRTLYIVRHAHAKNQIKRADIDRELSNRGLSEAQFMADRLHALPQPPTLLIASSAKRTTQTARILAEKTQATVDLDPSLYMCTAGTLLAKAQDMSDELSNVAIVGHNPAVTAVVLLLGFTELEGELPTMGVYRHVFEGSWSELGSVTPDESELIRAE